MPRKFPRLLWLAAPLAYILYLYGLTATGLFGPDEPRYAFISRAMAQSGDWITPRLWGSPWFEKPALLYWLQAAALRIGIPQDLAPRLPVALLAIAFLVFFWWILNREFGCRIAWIAVLILGTSGMWIGYSQAGVTDLPLTATFAAAMLLALPWISRGDTRWLPASAAMFGLAALAKGLVPIALAAPLLMGGRMRDWLRPRVVLPFLVLATPWYFLCYLKNGSDFLYEFFVVQHFSRVTSDALMHVQPRWFYLPVLLAALLPWTPLLAAAFTKSTWRDPRGRFLAVWALWVLLLFSIALNKLAGYILPALPALAALISIRLDELPRARVLLAACGALTLAFPIAARLLPAAMLSGLSHAPRPAFDASWLLAPAVAIFAGELDRRKYRLAAVALIAAAVGIGVLQLKIAAAPLIERNVSARTLWREIQPRAHDVCLAGVKRDWDYGLAWYAGFRLPPCDVEPKPWQVAPALPDGAILQPKP
jgi:4-amino-4-deoxy-L-arabinose transferase-like glycosyltransferase